MHGVLRVNKPIGLTSHDVVHQFRKILGRKDIGHAGTLDPMAEGLLVLLVGQATKISNFLLTGDKAYRAQVKLGMSTDTLDLEGQVLETSEVQVSKAELIQAVDSLQGEFSWEVPHFSAVKSKGQKLYEKARRGEDFKPPKKIMRFDRVELLGYHGDLVEVSLQCSKGSFIRTWAQQLGVTLGVPSCLNSLQRTYSAPFTLADSLSLSQGREMKSDEVYAHSAFVPLKNCLQQMPAISLRGKDLRLMQNGQIPHSLNRRLLPEQKAANRSGNSLTTRVLDGEEGHLVALLEVRPCASLAVKRIMKSP